MRVKCFIRIAFDVIKKPQNVHIFHLQIKNKFWTLVYIPKQNESISVKKDENGREIRNFLWQHLQFSLENAIFTMN
jgi:hypothetical protein